jgi:glycine/D-amino acid oxidase-like deaminating enzyme/nitrite reductase/ring-hydroxylating ferredoxin subunit
VPELLPEPSSLWVASTEGPELPSLEGRHTADVAVVGGGIVGIATAYRLKLAGLRVSVIEADRILSGTTGHTTAKLTAGHGIIYSHLEKHFGEPDAHRYAEASEWGLAEIEQLSRQLDIECDFERRANVVYSEDQRDVDTLKEEAAAAARAGLDASFVETIDLPYPVAGAVQVSGEAQYHPRKFLLGLAARIPGDGSQLYESSRVTGIQDGNPCVVRTDAGRIEAKQVVVATNMSILHRGLLYARAFPKRHYVIAGPAEHLPERMYLSTEPTPHSIRTVPLFGDRVLLVAGESHAVGQKNDTEACYQRLVDWAQERLGLRDVQYRWSAQDWYSADRVPLIGPISASSRRISTATGFGGWGMAPGIAASRILADRILDQENPWASLFSPRRAKLAAAPKLVEKNTKVAIRRTTDMLPLPGGSLKDLAPGQGDVVRHRGKKVAAYRDPAGHVHAVSPKCTHLGCDVEWNGAERSWDCPCHGSRFGTDGSVLNGPATKSLERRDVRET